MQGNSQFQSVGSKFKGTSFSQVKRTELLFGLYVLKVLERMQYPVLSPADSHIKLWV